MGKEGAKAWAFYLQRCLGVSQPRRAATQEHPLSLSGPQGRF